MRLQPKEAMYMKLTVFKCSLTVSLSAQGESYDCTVPLLQRSTQQDKKMVVEKLS